MTGQRHVATVLTLTSRNTTPAPQERYSNMLGASFLPARLRHEYNHDGPATNPSYLNQQVTALLQWVSRGAFTHPIHTIVSVALVASTCYIGLLEGSLLDHTSLGSNVGNTNFALLAEDARCLRVGDETSWKWQLYSNGAVESQDVSSEISWERRVRTQTITGPEAHCSHDACLPRL